MVNRRTFAKLLGATALSGCGFAARAIAQDARLPISRGTYLIKGGAVVTVDPALGTLPRADVLVSQVRIEAIGVDLSDASADVIDATDMIVMPGSTHTHVERARTQFHRR